MPGLLTNDAGTGRKRKHDGDAKPRKAPKTKSGAEDAETKILRLEQEILQGKEHYNNIVELQNLISKVDSKSETLTLAAIALCRVFCRLIAGEELVRSSSAGEGEAQVVQWLKARLRDYVDSLITWLGDREPEMESLALNLLMRVVKQEASQGGRRSEQSWRTESSTFYAVVKTLIEDTDAEGPRAEFVETYLEEHDDVRYYTFVAIKQVLKTTDEDAEEVAANGVDILAAIEGVPDSDDQLEDWYGEPPSPENKQLVSLNAHRKVAQEAWLSVFRSPLSRDTRKRILSIATTQILPWFAARVEMLADFLTDSFDQGGSLALLAMSSIFHLMTERNLDYPDFYTKLYSLLDEDVLHSKHRSRFFRLLDTFMSSTHLPATMVASFIKRLSSLSLHAPPGAIVWIVPWVYNMLKHHPACTFVLHRPYHPAHTIYANNLDYNEQGINDTFDPLQPDPNITGAIDSSLWELETLQSHFHPNVATLAKIMGEQFTKREYSLEDFLDHSYATLVDAELGKEVRKVPVVEWEIPRRIVTRDGDEVDGGGGLNKVGGLLRSALLAMA
ncbi:Maturation and nuclear export of 40S ribosomal subunits interacting protein [Recurvomyces mirabilis]|nr:Maturation and nuclear export of 40S ribosomal subunits interacting protein [Recurvomyces mirabilis]